jgi:DNA helicase-2/ATP-dependent DNA helicase PcrA
VAELFDFGAAQTAATISEQLNEQQRAAILHGEGPMLVVAGAGTGKTRVITERIRYLLGANPDLRGEQILGLTFTNKAAGEMQHRVASAVGERGKAVELCTFHAFCTALFQRIDPGRRILTNEDHWILLRRNLRRLALDKYRRLAEPGQFLGDFVRFFSRCQDELITPDDYQRYADGLVQKALAAEGVAQTDEVTLMLEEAAKQQEIARAYRESDALLREGRLLTFGSMLMDAVRRIDADAALAAEMRERYRYVLVDEFQDTNIAQLELLWRLAGAHRNIFAVGDDDQAIYRFRGASFGSFKLFIERFGDKSAPDGNCPVQALTKNYRSTERILRVANQVISMNERADFFPVKELVAQSKGGPKIREVELASAAHEARWVAGEIERLHAAGGRWRSFAALYRTHANRDLLVQELSARGIPFVIRNLSIFGNSLVRDLIAYFRLIAQPSDNVAFARVFAMPGWRFQPQDLVRLAERAQRAPLWDALVAEGAEAKLSPGNRGAELVSLITSLRKRARRATTAEIFSELAAKLDLFIQAGGDYRPYVERLAQFIKEWEPKSETQRLSEFVEYLDFFQQAGGQINLEEEGAHDSVQLMTVHAAKGLEFDHVFLMRLTQGNFPKRARPAVLEFPDELMKEERPEGDFKIQEERRLFYVALTRARQRLTITSVVDGKRNKASLFLDDILENGELVRRDIERLEPKDDASAGAQAKTRARESGGAPDLFASEREGSLVFSRLPEWAEEYRPPAFEPLKLSASAIDCYSSCPQKYLFSHVWRIRGGPNAAITFGSTMHTTIKHFIGELRGGRKLPFEEVAAIFEREWSSAGFEDDYQLEEYKKDGIDQLRVFHAAMLAEPPDVREQEKPFELPMDGNVILTGRMDQVNNLGHGHEIVDFKTGKPKTDEHARKDLQLTIYALAAREAFELNPVRLVLHNLQDNSRAAATRDEKAFKKLRGIIDETAASIRAQDFEAKVNSFACRYCEFQPICPAHEQALILIARD